MARWRVEATGEATGQLLGATIHGAAGLQGLAELSRLFAVLAAGRAFLEVGEKLCRVHELQLVIVIRLDQEARRAAVHHPRRP